MLLHSQYTNDESCYYLQIFALLMLIYYIPHFHEISQFFLYNVKRKGQEWAPPPPAILLIRSIKFLCLVDYQDWDSKFFKSPRVRNDIYLEGTWFAKK